MSVADSVFAPISIFDRLKEPQFLKLQNKPPDGGIGCVAIILFQLLGRELSSTVSGENEVPKGGLLFCDLALGKGIIEGYCGGRNGQSIIKLVIHILNEVHQKRRHIVLWMACAN